MRVTDFMSRPVVCVHPGTGLRDATALLVDNASAALPVVESDFSLVGIVTEADLLRGTVWDPGRGLARARKAMSVAEVMTSTVVTVPIGATLAECQRTMLADRLRCVPVVDEDGRVVGLVSRGDLLRTLLREDDVIAAKVRRLLADYAGDRPDWSVRVVAGATEVSGEFSDEAERGLVTALVRTVPGVTSVDLRLRYAPAAGASTG